MLAQELQVIPLQRRPRIGCHEPLHGSAWSTGSEILQEADGEVCLLGQRRGEGLQVQRELGRCAGRASRPRRAVARVRLIRRIRPTQFRSKHRIARILRDAPPLHERQRSEIQVTRAPAEHRGVERQHDGRATAGLGTLHERSDEFVGPAPVELEPPRAIAHRGGASFHRHRLRGLFEVRRPHRHGRQLATDAGDVDLPLAFPADVRVGFAHDCRQCSHRRPHVHPGTSGRRRLGGWRWFHLRLGIRRLLLARAGIPDQPGHRIQ